MSRRFLSFVVLSVAVCAFVGSHAAAQSKAQKKVEAKIKEAAKQELNLAEVTLFRNAYLLMNAANADYSGHRGAAMRDLNHAIRILEIRIDHKGTPAQVMNDLRQESITAYYKSLRKTVPAVIEPQIISNAQMYQAGQLLSQVRPVLAKNNQGRILGYVDGALREIGLALRSSP